MSDPATIGLIASIASLILAIVAIALSFAFFWVSSQLSEKTRDAANRVDAGVERLEKLFGTLYDGTFKLVDDAYSDMRKKLFFPTDNESKKAAEEAERRADEKFGQLRESLQREMLTMLHRQRVTDERRQKITNGKIESLAEEMRGLIDKAISGSRQVEAEVREADVHKRIVSVLTESGGGIRTTDLLDRVSLEPSIVLEKLHELWREKKIGIDVPNFKDLKPGSRIFFGPRWRPQKPDS